MTITGAAEREKPGTTATAPRVGPGRSVGFLLSLGEGGVGELVRPGPDLEHRLPEGWTTRVAAAAMAD
jgi:hypothetical protein